MNLQAPRSVWMLLTALSILTLLPSGPAACDESGPQPERPDFATISRALDGDPAAIESLLNCADRDSDCRTIAAAALTRRGRVDKALELLLPAVGRGNRPAAKIVVELAFDRQDYALAWAAGSIWMEAGDLAPVEGDVENRGMRVPWLMGQSRQHLSDSNLQQAERRAEEIRSRHEPDAGTAPSSSAQPPVPPKATHRSPPEYPSALMEAGAGGWAVMALSVSAEGRVVDVRALFSSDPALADASMRAIEQWRFEPRTGDGWWDVQSLEFEISDWPSVIPEAESGVPDEQGWIRFDDARGWIEFTVRVNGMPVRAMLDSGAERNAISRRLVERADIDLNLAEKFRVRGVYGEEVVSTAGAFEMRFGNATVPIRGALVLPMRSPELILGVSLFQASVVQIDYPNKRIRFLNRDGVSFEGNVRTRTKRGRSPQVAGELNGKRVWLLLDTGNAGATLFKRRLLKRLKLDQYAIEDAEINGMGAVAGGRNRLLQLPGFKLGPFGFETLLAGFIEEGADRGFEARRARLGSRIKRDRAPYDGILGSEVLKNFVITTDLKNGEVHFAVP